MGDAVPPEPPEAPEPPEPPEAPEPPEEQLAEQVESTAPPTAARSVVVTALRELADVDRAVYRAIAETPTPTLDEPLRRLSQAANRSALWLGVAGTLAIAGGEHGRRAALGGVTALALNSALVNVPMKMMARRARPDRDAARVPSSRWVRMPASGSFPSGHAASAFAFAGAVSAVVPQLSVPLRAGATAVAYSRVHTGVHFPGDVIVGALVGATIGEVTSLVMRRRERRH